jgi:hypothetical protein
MLKPYIIGLIAIISIGTALATSQGAFSFVNNKFKLGREFGSATDDYSAYDYLFIWLSDIWGPNRSTDLNPYYEGQFLQVCKDQNKIPMIYTYIIPTEAKAKWGLGDCNIESYNNLCRFGADFIRQNRDYLVQRYKYHANAIAKILGRYAKVVFLMEIDY